MAYDLRPERVEISSGELTVEVSRIGAYPIWVNAVRLASAWAAAKTDQAVILALREVYGTFIAEAQPTWAIIDHRGPVPPTTEGMWRLPVPLAMGLVSEWMDTIVEKSTAVDELIPPSPLRDQLNAKLRAKRKAA